MQERVSQARSWLSVQSRTARISLGVSALVLVSCGCCGGFVAAALGSTSPNKQAAAASQPTVTQALPTATATPATPTATPKPKAWQNIEHFSGTDTQQTPTFHTPDGARIVWSATASNEFGGSFSITSYGADGSYGDLIANTSTPPKASGTFNVHGDQDIYLKVDTYGCTYDIAVQVYK